jgi:septum formation protein
MRINGSVIDMIILASKSPRREQLLKEAGIEFVICPSDIDESMDLNLSPEEIVMDLAKQKALAVSLKYPKDIVIGADTIVVLQKKILGKPKDEEDAYQMLKTLSGVTHQVFTGVTLVTEGKSETFFSESKVTMKPFSHERISKYVESLEPMDKAGAYAIQGLGSELVEKYEGDFFTIMGLPISQLLLKLKAFQ